MKGRINTINRGNGARPVNDVSRSISPNPPTEEDSSGKVVADCPAFRRTTVIEEHLTAIYWG